MRSLDVTQDLHLSHPGQGEAIQETIFKINIQTSTSCKNVPTNNSSFYLMIFLGVYEDCRQDTWMKTISLNLQEFFLFLKKNKRRLLKEDLEAWGHILQVIRIQTGKTSVWATKELWDLIRTFNDVQGMDEWKHRECNFLKNGMRKIPQWNWPWESATANSKSIPQFWFLVWSV